MKFLHVLELSYTLSYVVQRALLLTEACQESCSDADLFGSDWLIIRLDTSINLERSWFDYDWDCNGTYLKCLLVQFWRRSIKLSTSENGVWWSFDVMYGLQNSPFSDYFVCVRVTCQNEVSQCQMLRGRRPMTLAEPHIEVSFGLICELQWCVAFSLWYKPSLYLNVNVNCFVDWTTKLFDNGCMLLCQLCQRNHRAYLEWMPTSYFDML